MRLPPALQIQSSSPGFSGSITSTRQCHQQKGESDVCLRVNSLWCSDKADAPISCTLHLEHLTVKCRPFHHLDDLPPSFHHHACSLQSTPGGHSARTRRAACHGQQSPNFNAFPIRAGDFNNARLKNLLPNYHRHVFCSTRGLNTRPLLLHHQRYLSLHSPVVTLENQTTGLGSFFLFVGSD